MLKYFVFFLFLSSISAHAAEKISCYSKGEDVHLDIERNTTKLYVSVAEYGNAFAPIPEDEYELIKWSNEVILRIRNMKLKFVGQRRVNGQKLDSYFFWQGRWQPAGYDCSFAITAD